VGLLSTAQRSSRASSPRWLAYTSSAEPPLPPPFCSCALYRSFASSAAPAFPVHRPLEDWRRGGSGPDPGGSRGGSPEGRLPVLDAYPGPGRLNGARRKRSAGTASRRGGEPHRGGPPRRQGGLRGCPLSPPLALLERPPAPQGHRARRPNGAPPGGGARQSLQPTAVRRPLRDPSLRKLAPLRPLMPLFWLPAPLRELTPLLSSSSRPLSR